MISRLLVIIGAVSYVLAWLLPAIKPGKSMVRGWEAFQVTLMSEWPDKGDPFSEWYGSCLVTFERSARQNDPGPTSIDNSCNLGFNCAR